ALPRLGRAVPAVRVLLQELAVARERGVPQLRAVGELSRPRAVDVHVAVGALEVAVREVALGLVALELGASIAELRKLGADEIVDCLRHGGRGTFQNRRPAARCWSTRYVRRSGMYGVLAPLSASLKSAGKRLRN